MIDERTLDEAKTLLQKLQHRTMRIVTAESCTGGLVAAALTHHPGSSGSVLGGFVTYSNEMKHRLLGVDMTLFDQVGAVSAEVAAAMADGALDRSDADLAVSITGIAGPGGATPGKPVGLVWFGVARRGQAARTRQAILPGDRTAIRNASVLEALMLLHQALDEG